MKSLISYSKPPNSRAISRDNSHNASAHQRIRKTFWEIRGQLPVLLEGLDFRSWEFTTEFSGRGESRVTEVISRNQWSVVKASTRCSLTNFKILPLVRNRYYLWFEVYITHVKYSYVFYSLFGRSHRICTYSLGHTRGIKVNQFLSLTNHGITPGWCLVLYCIRALRNHACSTRIASEPLQVHGP